MKHPTSNIQPQNKSQNKNHKLQILGYWKLLIVICLGFGCLMFGFVANASPKTSYDGIWFMGFNLHKPLLADIKVRQAINAAIDTPFITQNIVSSETVPVSIIPPGLLGYDPDLKPSAHNPKLAKQLLSKANIKSNDPLLKKLSLLHTDGVLTVKIAKKIQKDLQAIGIKLKLVQVPYMNEENWAKELASGHYDFFLMGYKANFEQLLTSEVSLTPPDSLTLVEPLFQSGGEANFTGYTNANVDRLMDQLDNINPALNDDRNVKLKQVNHLLYQDLPVIVLFYIEKL